MRPRLILWPASLCSLIWNCGAPENSDAISACAKCVALDNWWLPHLYLVAAYAQKGDSANTDVEKATLLRLRPAISISDFKGLWYSDNPDFVQQSEAHLLAGLRKAGIPEQ